jgi:hypothetical protein
MPHILMRNKWIAVPWALRFQRVALQGSFFSRALLYFRVKLSILGLLLQGSGVVIKGLFFFWQSVYIFLINKLDNSSVLCANLFTYKL